MSNRKNVVVIPGDDAAPEAMHPTIDLLQALALDINFEFPPYGDDAVESIGTGFPDETRAAIDAADATLFGAGSKDSTEIVRYLRWGKGTYANVRPARWVPGCKSPLANPENATSSSCERTSRTWRSESAAIWKSSTRSASPADAPNRPFKMSQKHSAAANTQSR